MIQTIKTILNNTDNRDNSGQYRHRDSYGQLWKILTTEKNLDIETILDNTDNRDNPGQTSQ